MRQPPGRRRRRRLDGLLLTTVVVSALLAVVGVLAWATVRGAGGVGGWVVVTSRASCELRAIPGHFQLKLFYTTWPVRPDRRFRSSRPTIRLPDGIVETGFLNDRGRALGVEVHRQEYMFQSWTDGAQYAFGSRTVYVPYWLLVGLALSVSVAAGAWRRHRRRGPGLGMCPACGYDLRATPDRCPECGAAPTAPPA